MKNLNSYNYIQVGLLLRLLANLNPNIKSSFVRGELNKLKEALERVGFTVSSSNFNTSFFIDLQSKLNLIEDEIEIGTKLCTEFKTEMMVIERHVLSESATKKVHILPDRRFNTDYLLTNHHKLFAAGCFKKLTDLAQTDITSACRCLLFGEATASAFHILRSTEDTLKQYYFHHIRQNRLKKPMWGPMLDKLKNKSRNKPPKTLLSSLDLIREAYRNPTQHPDALYTIDTAQDLFGVCIDVIGKMSNEL